MQTNSFGYNIYPEINAIVLNYNQEKTNVILGKKCETIYGRGYIYDILGEYKFNWKNESV